MKSALFALVGLLAATANAIELTPDNYDEVTAGKTVLIKFLAPCDTQLIADVDCTTEGKPLCEANGIRGYPTIKWGDPAALEDYQGGRDFKTLKKFAEEKLKPMCSPSNIDLCDDDKKAEIKKFMDMSDADLEKSITDKEAEMAAAEEEFKTFVEDLQSKYQEGMKKKDETLDAIKESGLGLMKAVKVSKTKKGSDEL